ncbi:MAG: thiamine biosynthesis protein ThiJ [Chryseobacterium sp.]|nr:MAG: thiamine biosynthesis protein ThiJ [Chryseobacterium sp.]
MKLLKLMILTFLMSAFVAFAQKNRVLFITSGAKELKLQNGKSYENTGVFLSELYLPYIKLKNLGYEIDFATPNAVVSPIDKESFNRKYWKKNEMLLKEAILFVKENLKFNNPHDLKKIVTEVDDYSGIVIPGGQGLMVDLLYDKNIPNILRTFAEKGKPIGLICHAPVLLLTIPKENNPFIGYKVNSVTGFEEFFIENFIMKGKPQNRKIAKQLKNMGLDHQKTRPGGDFAIRDRELITSQNPFSNETFNNLYLEALKEYGDRTSKNQ